LGEEMLIQRLKNKDEKAFWEFQSKYREDIYRTAFLIVKNSEDALDVCQNVLLKVWHRIDQYEPRPGKSFGAWLYTVTRNEARNFLRNEIRGQNLLYRDLEMTDSEINQIPHPQSCPSKEVERNELSRIIVEIMNSRLTPRERCFFKLKHVEGFTYKEIAERKNRAVGTIKATIASAVRKMVKGLKQRGINPADYS
jgi:RNA polymerase sigma-70 factor (ECF subfamily)